MKCPECGFDCLPDDVECLACGINIAAAAENKEKERIRSIEAAERKKKYEIELKKELGLIPDDKEKPAAPKGTTLEETFKKKPSCPKCGAPRHPEASECLKCGVIFDRIEPASSGEDKNHQNAETVEAPTPSAPKQVTTPPDVIPPEDKTNEIDLNDLEIVDRKEEKPSEPASAPVTPAEEPRHYEEPVVTESVNENQKHANQEPVPEPPAVEAPPVESDKQPVEIERTVANERTEDFDDNEKTEIIDLEKVGFQKKPDSKTTDYKEKLRTGASDTFKRLESGLAQGKGKLKEFLNNKRNLQIVAGVAVVLAFVLVTTFGVSYYKHYKVEKAKREHAEKLEKIRLDFVTRKDDINNKIKTLILNRLFESAEKEIALYDIESLQNDLQPLKNYLKEIKLYEKAKKIPGREYENNYKVFLELQAMAPDNEVYTSKAELYKKRLAEREYTKAKAYLTSKNKNVNDLEQALGYIDLSLELYPGTKNYISVKQKLMTEKLLYYEGNENIVMAVRDDGMGKKLFSNQRKLTIWLKNISNEEIYINVQFFTMIGKDKKEYTYNDMGKKLKSKLDPGEQSVGELYFRTRTSPKKLIFNHLIKGKISREFP